MNHKIAKRIFYILLLLSVVGFLAITSQLPYPFVTVKALVFRSLMLLTLPIYAFLASRDKTLRPNFKNPISWALVAFFAVGLLSSALGVNFNRSFWGNFERMGGMYNLLYFVLLYFYLELLFKLNAGWWQTFLQWLVYLGVLTSVYGALTKFGLPDKFYPDGSLPARVSSIFGNPIFFASFLILPMFLAAFFALQNRGRKSAYWWWTAAAVQLLGIYLSATRGAAVGVVAGLGIAVLVFFLLIKNQRARLYGLGVVALALVGLLGLLVISKHLSPSSILSRLTDFSDSNTQARLIQWQTALKGFPDRPVLGAGPENYYVIANKYFNPAIYEFDRSWFDKPHNYQLELLVTEGALGLLAYLVLIGFNVYALYKAFQKQLVSLAEFCLLLGGLVAYQVQNLFVFDTVAASFAFFAFIAFTAYLWHEARGESDASRQKQKQSKKPVAVSAWPKAIFWPLLVAAVYLFYLTDYLPAKAMYNVNQGVYFGVNQPQQAQDSFNRAAGVSMNYDLDQTAQRYEEAVSALALNYQGKVDLSFVENMTQDAINVLQKAIRQTDNDPVLWYKLANMKATKAYLAKAGNDQSVKQAAETSVSLAPNRTEPKFYLAQYYQLQKDWPAAIAELKNIAKIDYTSVLPKWRLALMYKEAGDLPRAAFMARIALKGGYVFTNEAEMRWLVNYYADQNQLPQVIDIYQRAIKVFPGDFQLYANLASAYAKAGDKAKALEMAQKVLQLSPESQAQVDTFIKSLH